MSVTPYPDLDAAIVSAAGQYGVPADVLAGIWRIESGSSFPNPYVNSSGYGGLFGIGQAQALSDGFSLYDPGTTQQQANVAAQDLANLVRANGGDLSKALLAYSGNGYSSVPGQSSTSNTSASGNPTANAAVQSLSATLHSLPPAVLVGGAALLLAILLD